MSRSVFPFAVVLPALFSFLRRQWNKRNYSTPISEMFFTFITRKTLREKLFELSVCKVALQAASAYKRREFWSETHPPLRLLIRRSIFLTREKHPSWFSLDVAFFFHVWKPLFAPLIGWNSFAIENLRHIFWWVFLSMYMINSQTSASLHSSAFRNFFFLFYYVLF